VPIELVKADLQARPLVSIPAYLSFPKTLVKSVPELRTGWRRQHFHARHPALPPALEPEPGLAKQ